MKKIAIISDIHGNLESLMAVLEDIKGRNVD
ncbi:MAG: metallophosphoesterase family protein, partial [Bacilli bacterium]|nr:metallophosphoesterase family protein [Bacilli bacterium]